MAGPAAERMTVDGFLAWCDRHAGDDRWELVDGEPRMMVRPLPIHRRLSFNLTSELEACLDGTSCEAIQEGAVSTSERRLRYPDIVVYCGETNMRDRMMGVPTVIIEVLSPSTEDFDLIGKHEEFRAIDSLRHIVFVHAERVHAYVWTRDEDGWSDASASDLDATLELDAIDCRIRLARVYRNTDLA